MTKITVDSGTTSDEIKFTDPATGVRITADTPLTTDGQIFAEPIDAATVHAAASATATTRDTQELVNGQATLLGHHLYAVS